MQVIWGLGDPGICKDWLQSCAWLLANIADHCLRIFADSFSLCESLQIHSAFASFAIFLRIKGWRSVEWEGLVVTQPEWGSCNSVQTLKWLSILLLNNKHPSLGFLRHSRERRQGDFRSTKINSYFVLIFAGSHSRSDSRWGDSQRYETWGGTWTHKASPGRDRWTAGLTKRRRSICHQIFGKYQCFVGVGWERENGLVLSDVVSGCQRTGLLYVYLSLCWSVADLIMRSESLRKILLLPWTLMQKRWFVSLHFNCMLLRLFFSLWR